jgi:hypothetical protein
LIGGKLSRIGAGGPVGYFGLNMGTATRVPLTASERRITAAVFGLFWPDSIAETARQITVPIEFVLQWDDGHIPSQSGLALFDGADTAVHLDVRTRASTSSDGSPQAAPQLGSK